MEFCLILFLRSLFILPFVWLSVHHSCNILTFLLFGLLVVLKTNLFWHGLIELRVYLLVLLKASSSFFGDYHANPPTRFPCNDDAWLFSFMFFPLFSHFFCKLFVFIQPRLINWLALLNRSIWIFVCISFEFLLFFSFHPFLIGKKIGAKTYGP